MSAGPISEAEYRTWVSPATCLKLFEEWGYSTAARTIATRLVNGLIRSVARRSVARIGRGERELWPVPRQAWSQWACLGDSDFWRTGDLRIHEPAVAEGQAVAGDYFGVRFDPKDLEALREESGLGDRSAHPLPTPGASPGVATRGQIPAETASRNSGGRPSKGWWEDLLIEIARQLWAGDLQPNKQADIEKAMHEWIVAQGHSAGETQVRERARKLFRALTE